MKRIKQGFLPSDEKTSRFFGLLILPAAAVLFGFVSSVYANAFSESSKTIFMESQQRFTARSGLSALVLAFLLALLIVHLRNTAGLFHGKIVAVFTAALIFSPIIFLFPQIGTTRVAAWLAELVFLLFAAKTSLQISLLPPGLRYKNASLCSLLFLLLSGGFVALDQANNLEEEPVIAFGILVLLFLSVQIICQKKQRNIRLMQIAMDDSDMAGNLKLALGTEGIRQLLPYFHTQMSNGSSVARLLILELIRGADFTGKENLVRAAFDSGPLEVRFAIVDQIFNWGLPYSLLTYAVEHCEPSLAEYLVRKIFLNYSDITDHGALENLLQRSDCLRCFPFPEETQEMFAYVFDGKKDKYACILNRLLKSNRKEDRLFAAEIMAAYVGREDEVNKKYLAEVMENTVFNPVELEEMIELCAEYDRDMHYLKKYLSNYYSYEFLKKIWEYYEPVSVAKSFSSMDAPVPLALTLLAACRLDKSSLKMYREKKNQLMGYISRLCGEERKILAAEFGHAKLLTDEIKSLKQTLMAIFLEYTLLDENGARTDNAVEVVKQVLDDGDMDCLSPLGNSGESLQKILAGETASSVNFDYNLLEINENNTILESIYRYLGGEALDTNLTENIEKLITLKSIPMFSDLDIFTLQQIQKISAYKKIPAGETIITEGEEGTSLYVVINGKVGVYKGNQLINEIGAGGLLGEMAIIEKQRRSATITTLNETSFLVIAGDDFMKLLERNSSISISVIKTLTSRLRKMLEVEK